MFQFGAGQPSTASASANPATNKPSLFGSTQPTQETGQNQPIFGDLNKSSNNSADIFASNTPFGSFAAGQKRANTSSADGAPPNSKVSLFQSPSGNSQPAPPSGQIFGSSVFGASSQPFGSSLASSGASGNTLGGGNSGSTLSGSASLPAIFGIDASQSTGSNSDLTASGNGGQRVIKRAVRRVKK